MKDLLSKYNGFGNKDWLRSDFFLKVMGTLFTRLSVMGMSFLISVVLVRELEPKGAGLYAAAMSVSMIGIQLGNLGLHVPNTFLVSRDKAKLPKLIANSIGVSMGVGGLGALTGGLIFLTFPSLAPLNGLLMGLSLLLVPFGVAYFLFQNLLLGLQDVKNYMKIEVASKIFQLALVGFIAWRFHFDVWAFFACSLTVTIISCFWQLQELRKHCQDSLAPSLALFKQHFGFGLKSYLVNLFCFLVIWADLLIVKYLLGAEKTGYYSVAAKMAEVVTLLPGSIAMILFPKLSALKLAGDRWRLAREAFWTTTLCLMPLLAGFYFLADLVVPLVYGKAFLPSILPFKLLIPGVFFLAIQQVMVQFLKSEGFPVQIPILWGVLVFLNIGLNIFVVPRFGIEGAAVVSSFCYLLAFVFVMYFIRRTLSAKS